MSDLTEDLGFTHRKTRDGYMIFHHGRLAATLRGSKAMAFESALTAGDDAEQQRLMARLTGNYKRGNERSAWHHPKRGRP